MENASCRSGLLFRSFDSVRRHRKRAARSRGHSSFHCNTGPIMHWPGFMLFEIIFKQYTICTFNHNQCTSRYCNCYPCPPESLLIVLTGVRVMSVVRSDVTRILLNYPITYLHYYIILFNLCQIQVHVILTPLENSLISKSDSGSGWLRASSSSHSTMDANHQIGARVTEVDNKMAPYPRRCVSS
jgi:hypothetical protein